MASHVAATTELHFGPAASPPASAWPDEPVWRDNLEGRYRTEDALVAELLPPPLEPTDEPVIRVAVATGTLPDGTAFGEARATVQARYGDLVGEYVLLVLHDREQAMLEDRERLGLPAKLGQITSKITDQRIDHTAKRNGASVATVVGMVYDVDQPTPAVRTEFAYRTQRTSSGDFGLAADPELVVITRSIEERRAAKVQGVVRPGACPTDPLRQLKVRKTLGLRLSQQFVTVAARTIGSVPADDYLPFIHHRYEVAPATAR